MRPLKVWAGSSFDGRRKDIRVVAVAPTIKRALEILSCIRYPVTRGEFAGYWSEVRNSVELQLKDFGEGVWYTHLIHDVRTVADYTRVEGGNSP